MKTQSHTPSCRIGGTPKSLLCELGLPNSCTSATRHRTPRRRGLCLLVSPVNGQKLAHFTAPPLPTKSLILRGPYASVLRIAANVRQLSMRKSCYATLQSGNIFKQQKCRSFSGGKAEFVTNKLLRSSKKRVPLTSSANPLRFPAIEKDWQGKPPIPANISKNRIAIRHPTTSLN